MGFVIKKQDILKYLIIIVIISVTLCFTIKYLGLKGNIPWIIGYNDVGGWASKAFEPGLPYLDKTVEYPVLIGMTMFFAAKNNLNYYMFFHYFVFLATAIITTIYLYKLSEKLNSKKINLFIFWALAPSLLWFSFFNWDIITVMFSVLALYYFKENKNITGAIFLSLGFASKMYPILFLLPILMHRKFLNWIKIGITFVITWLAVNIYFMLTNYQGWYFFFQFSSERLPNIDSIWAIISRFIPGLSIQVINIVTLVLFALIYISMNIKFKNQDFIFMSFLSVLLFLIINKVFSPQFTLWLLPFFALYGVKISSFYSLELSNIIILFTTLTHIFSHQEFTTALVFSGIFVVIRHIILIYILLTNYKIIVTKQ
jgi:uncharacterized membrane protein